MIDWGNKLIGAFALGIKEKDFWRMTPFQYYLRVEAEKEKVKSINIVNLHMLNTILNMFGSVSEINYKDIFGIEQMKDYNLLGRKDFKTRKEFDEYLQEVVIPLQDQLGE